MLPWFIEQLDPRVYLSDDYLVVDLETDTGAGAQNYGHARHAANHILLACWKTAGGQMQRCWGNELEQGALSDAISAAKFVVAHNAKYELGHFKRMGIDLRKVLVYDTKLAE